MDARGLETLRAVHDRGGVSAAAAALHVTPSAVSQQLRVLQRDAGVVLVERVGRGVRLTPAGLAVAEAAGEVAVALERARTAGEAFLARPVGTVRVTAFQSAAQMLLPGLLTRVAALDGVSVECGDEDVAQSDFPDLTLDWDIVVAHRADAGQRWPTSGQQLRVVPLLREPLDVALPPGHRLADREQLRPEDLAGESWITVREGFPVAHVLDAVATRSGDSPRIVQRINDFHVVEALVAAGHGVSLLPRYTTDHGGRFRLVPLVGVAAGRRIDALLRPDRAERRLVGEVLELLRAEARRQSVG